MTRAIVHKTKGKLDLRSLTVFGMNAKPNTNTPIGYFGTGLKYAIAVLARNRIPVTFWIDRKQWVIEVDPTSFRGRDFQEIYICSTTIGGLIKKRIKLPFTTDLGKNWDLWQAFRELECNTRDEKGDTFVAEKIGNDFKGDIWDATFHGHTWIVVDDERYVNEYMNRDKHFLPDGLVAQEGTEYLQVFTRKSNHLYYRGVRIYDLKEPTENTYNFLKQVDLTEDRTAKYPWQLEMDIERYIATTQRRDVIERAITAPPRSYERGLSYEYTNRSELFLDMAAEAGDKATEHVKSRLHRDRPPEVPQDGRHWTRQLISAVDARDAQRILAICIDNKAELDKLLGEAADRAHAEAEQVSDGLPGGVQQEAGLSREEGSQNVSGTELGERTTQGNDVETSDWDIGRTPAGSIDRGDDIPF